jgi:hypothetical protein
MAVRQHCRAAWLAAWSALLPASGMTQVPATPIDEQRDEIIAVGWRGFLDAPFLLSVLAALLLAAGLGALIAFHPMTRQTMDTREEAEVPNVYIVYAVVGAVIGEMVRKYGLVIGLVVFGIGGLIRFRTDTGSTRNMGRLILVTLIGLSSGLGLPHFAVVTTLFAFGLIWLLDARPVRRLVVKELPPGRVAEAADAYREGLRRVGCVILSERKSFSKQHVAFVFRAKRRNTQEGLHAALTAQVPPEVRGELDWEVD